MSVSDETGQVKWISVHVLKVPDKFSNKMTFDSFGLLSQAILGHLSLQFYPFCYLPYCALWVSWAAQTKKAKQSEAFTGVCTLMFSCAWRSLSLPVLINLKQLPRFLSVTQDSWNAVSAMRSDIRAREMAIERCVTHFLNGSATSLSFPSECTTWGSKTMCEHDCQRLDESAFGKWVTRGLDGLVLHFTDQVLLQIARAVWTGVLLKHGVIRGYSVKTQKNINRTPFRNWHWSVLLGICRSACRYYNSACK